jgi:hypothetical protein
VTPYKPEMVQVCERHRSGGGGVHGAAEEAKDERSRIQSYFIIYRMISHHWHGHKAQINEI